MRGSRNRWHPRCGFCGLTLTVETGWKEVNVDIFECQKEIYLCRVRMQKRIVDLERSIEFSLKVRKAELEVERDTARVEALREVESRVRAMPISEETRRTFPTAECDMNAMRILIIALIERLIAREQPAPAEYEEESP